MVVATHDADYAAQAHTPVLLERCLDLLAPACDHTDATVIDATLGMGGHTEGMLRRFPHLTVIGIDRDPQAIELASQRLAQFGSRFVPVRTTYDHVAQVAQQYGRPIDGILLDAGVSSLQLDKVERGFSYARDAALDMRMNPDEGPTAAELIAQLSRQELIHILRAYGEENQASRIVDAIITQRAQAPITRTQQLVTLIRDALPAAVKRTGGNPAKRTFQALRIAVNSELDILEATIPAALSALRIGGRMVVESYHSLEDRIVKRAFSAASNVTAPAGLPVIPEADQPALRPLTRGAEQADRAEQEHNSRSKSVRLRAVEKIREYNPDRYQITPNKRSQR